MTADPFAAIDRMETLTNLLAAEVGRQVREQTDGARRSKADTVLSGMTHLQRRIVQTLAGIKYMEEGTRAEVARTLGVNPQGVLKALRPLIEQRLVAEETPGWDTKRRYLRLTPFGFTIADRFKQLRNDALVKLVGPDAPFLSATTMKHVQTAIKLAQQYIRGPIR